MNIAYKVIWSIGLKAWVVASELAKSRRRGRAGRGGKAMLAASLLAAAAGAAQAQALLPPYNPRDNDDLVDARIVNGGSTITLTGPQQFEAGDNGARSTTLASLRDLGRVVSGAEWVGAGRLNPGTMNFGVTVPDPITGGTRVVSAYNTANLNPLTPIGWDTTVPDLVDVNDEQYINARVGTVEATGGTLNVDIGSAGAASSAASNGWTMAAKQTSLFHADGTGGNASNIDWQSQNRIGFTGDVAAPNAPNAYQATYVSQYGGTFSVTRVDGVATTHTVTNAAELRTYNDWLIAQLRTGNLDPELYSTEFNKGYSSSTQNISYNVSAANASDEIFQGIGLRTVVHAVGANATGTIAVGGKLEVDNANGGAMRAENGARLVNAGTLAATHTVGDGSAMVLTGSSSGQNSGVINGNFFLNDDGSTVNGNYGSHVVDVLDGSTFDNGGIINLATGSANGAGASSGIHLGANTSATSSGIINVGVTGSRSNGSMTGVLVDDASATFTNDGTIYIGRGPQTDPALAPADVNVNQGSLTAGITVNGDATATNAGTITLGSRTQNAAAILVNGGANATVGNSGTIDINGRAAAVPRDNIGISVVNSGAGGGIGNTGTINLNGVNGIGIKVLGTGGSVANASSTGVINVAGAADPVSGTRNFGVWVEGRGSQAARATVGGQINLLGDGAIGIHARGFATVDVAASAVPTFSNGSNQIAFFAYGTGARINVASPSLEVTTAGSTLFRMENGASFDGTGLALAASGRNSVAVLATGAPSTVATNDAQIDVSGEGATGLVVEGGATGNIDAATAVQLTGAGSVAAIVDGQKHSLTGAASGSPNASTALTSAAVLTSSQSGLTGYIARNRATLTNSGNITFSGDHATGLRVESGATGNNSGNISIADGGTGILVDGSSGSAATTANSSGTIAVNGGSVADRSRGVVATGTAATANLQDGAQVQMLGTGAIGAEAINGATVNVSVNATPAFGNTDQIAFHAQGAGSRVVSAAASLDASTERSTIYRIDDGAVLALSGASTLTASGAGSRGIVASGAGTSVSNGTAVLNVAGADAAAMEIRGGATGNLEAGTTVDVDAGNGIGGIVDGQKLDLAGQPLGTPVATTLSNSATISGSGAGAIGFIARNQGTLLHTGSVDMTGAGSTGVWLQGGGALTNTGTVHVADGTGVRIEGTREQPLRLGTISVDNGVAGVHLLDGAQAGIDDADAITTHGSAHGILLGAGAAGLSLTHATITTDGTGNGIDNAAEIGNVSLQDATIRAGNGAGIRTATLLDPGSTATLDVEGSGIGFAFRQADGSAASGALELGEGYAINANGAGATGIQALTTGTVATAATVNVGHAAGGSALVAGTASSTTNRGALTSSSTAAPVVDLANGSGTRFTNTGTLAAAGPAMQAIRGSSGSDVVALGGGGVRGDIATGEGNDQFSWTAGTLDGGLRMGNGTDNQALLRGVDLSRTYHLLAGSGGGNTLTLDDIQAQGGSFASDDLGRGSNLGTGWSTINLDNGSELTLSDNLILGGEAVNIDPSSILFAGNGVHPTISSGTAGPLTVNNAGLINLTNGSGSPGNALTIAGNYAGQGGGVALVTTLNEGGVLGNQFSDRLLVQGNASGSTPLNVTLSAVSTGALTDLNHDSNVEANEGISLVQVAGASSPDAFALEGGYLAAGPWRYDLYAFAPGQSDATQRVVDGSGNQFWDYRLANAYVCPEGEDCTPQPPFVPLIDGNGELINPLDDGCVVDGIDTCAVGRPAVTPQVPSYVSTPLALASYGARMLDNLHKRLGEIRHDRVLEDGINGEVFARIIGGDYRYHSDQAFNRFGYDFDMNVQAVQLGTTLLDANRGHSSTRVGLAYTHGDAWLKPRAADGDSRTRFDNDSLGVYVTWLHENGFYLDGIVSGDRYRGEVSVTGDSRVARMRSSGRTASIESGYPFEFDNGFILEPQLQLTWQYLRTKSFVDRDGARVQYDAYHQSVGRLGVRLTRTWQSEQGRLHTPYLRVNYLRGLGDKRSQVTISDESGNISQDFYGGRFGSSWEYGLGGTLSLRDNLLVYGEIDYLQDSGDSGVSGLGGNLGLRWVF